MSDLAQQLYRARREDQCISIDAAPDTLDAAYALQQQIDALNDSPVVGYKLGATVQEILDAFSLQVPFHGFLKQSHKLLAGEPFTLPRSYPIRVEAEIVVAMKRDITLPEQHLDINAVSDEWVSEVADAVDWVAPGLEFVGSRIQQPVAQPGLSIIADSAGNVATLVGVPVAPDSLDLATQAVTLSINDRACAEGLGRDSVAGHPYAMVAWLLAQGRVASRGLKAGEHVFCGTCTGALPVQPGDSVHADFGKLGSVSVRLN